MKKTTGILFIMLMFPLLSIAQDVTKMPSKVKDVTVFYNGAELNHTASATLLKGDNELKIEGLSPYIDINSLKITTTNNVIVSAYEFTTEQLATAKNISPVIKKLQDSIQIYKTSLEKLNIDICVNEKLSELLQSGITKNVSGSEEGLKIDDLIKIMDYYKSKSESLASNQTDLNKKKNSVNQSLNRLQDQLDQEVTKGSKSAGVLKLNLSAPAAGNCSFTISYFTAAAKWVPYYDINITSTDKPVALLLKGKVSQTTGLDWEKVNLTLSTVTPSNGKVAPLFSTWFLEERKYPSSRSSQRPVMQNAFSYDQDIENVVVAGYGKINKVNLAGSVAGVNTKSSTQKQISQPPIVIINGNRATQEELSAIASDAIKNIDVLKAPEATSIYGSDASGGAIVVTLKQMEDYVTADENQLNLTYNIDLPYSIPGNGKEQNIDLQKKETAAEFKYYCAPKLDPSTYLLAEIPDWEKLGLLSGIAHITYEGTYVGATYINTASTHAKLSLTLGVDKRVMVKREKMQDYSSTKFLGNDVQNIFTYKLTVKNNQNKPIKMVLKDQYPISTNKNIEVVLRKETTPWTVNIEDMGVITWEEEFAAGETKTYNLSYSVKYPKHMRLNL